MFMDDDDDDDRDCMRISSSLSYKKRFTSNDALPVPENQLICHTQRPDERFERKDEFLFEGDEREILLWTIEKKDEEKQAKRAGTIRTERRGNYLRSKKACGEAKNGLRVQ